MNNNLDSVSAINGPSVVQWCVSRYVQRSGTRAGMYAALACQENLWELDEANVAEPIQQYHRAKILACLAEVYGCGTANHGDVLLRFGDELANEARMLFEIDAVKNPVERGKHMLSLSAERAYSGCVAMARRIVGLQRKCNNIVRPKEYREYYESSIKIHERYGSLNKHLGDRLKRRIENFSTLYLAEAPLR